MEAPYFAVDRARTFRKYHHGEALFNALTHNLLVYIDTVASVDKSRITYQSAKNRRMPNPLVCNHYHTRRNGKHCQYIHKRLVIGYDDCRLLVKLSCSIAMKPFYMRKSKEYQATGSVHKETYKPPFVNFLYRNQIKHKREQPKDETAYRKHTEAQHRQNQIRCRIRHISFGCRVCNEEIKDDRLNGERHQHHRQYSQNRYQRN